MMKLLIVAALVTLALAQNANQQRCWEGVITNGVPGNMTEVDCSGEGMSCQTKIEQNQGNTKVERKCKQTEACNNNSNNNGQNCYSVIAIQKRVRVCFYCCDTDLCNDFTEIPDATPEPLES